jgi:hypothetical protein
MTLSITTLSMAVLRAATIFIVMQSVIMLSIVMLNVVMLSVVAPPAFNALKLYSLPLMPQRADLPEADLVFFRLV